MSQQYPTTFIQTLLKLRNITRAAAGITMAATLATLPLPFMQKKGLGQFISLSIGLASATTSKLLASQMRNLNDIAEDLDIVDRRNQISWYQQLTTSSPTTVEVKYPQSWIGDNLLVDPVNYWLTQDKHLLIIGGTGDGKSTLIQALVQKLGGWHIRCYDPDATVDDWQGIPPQNVIGLGSKFDAIEQSMSSDLELLEERLADRSTKGKHWSTISMLTVAEELPALASEMEIAKDWVRGFAKRGRKAKMFICAIAQNDTVDNLGLKGDSDLRDSCFTRIYLGKKAVARAVKIGNQHLVDWLKAQPKGRFLVDDLPCEWVITPNNTIAPQLPVVNEQLSYSHPEKSPETPEPPSDKQFQVLEPLLDLRNEPENEPELTKELYLMMRRAGHSKSHILKEVFNITGRRYTPAAQQCDQWEQQQ